MAFKLFVEEEVNSDFQQVCVQILVYRASARRKKATSPGNETEAQNNHLV